MVGATFSLNDPGFLFQEDMISSQFSNSSWLFP